MFRLLIVDDERIILNGIRFLIEKRMKLPFEVDISVAPSGVAALDILSVFVPDLILTDIRMPVMDGFAFIEQVRARNLECDVAILTSHADFSYAKRAISFHVEDFLLKPIQVDELEKVLQDSYQKLEKNKKEEEQECLSMIRNLLLYDMSSEQFSMDAGNIYRIFPHRYFTVILVETEENGYDYTQNLEYEISYFYPVCKTFRFYQKKHYVTICSHDQFFINTKPLEEKIARLFLKERYYFSISISSNSWTELHSLYMNAQLRILCSKLYKDQKELADISFITYRDCIDILTDHNPLSVKEKLDGYLNKILAQYPETPCLMSEIGSSFIRNCNMYLENLGAELIRDPFGEKKVQSDRELSEILQEILQSYRKQKRMQENYSNEPMTVTQLASYIGSHYMEEISLESLADEMGMHPNYLCTLLRKHLGESYLTYLQKIRVEAAKKLLQDPKNYNLEEVALRVGLRGANQLIRTFKRVENITPGEYKKRME